VELVPAAELEIAVERAEGIKCERCWQYATDMEAGSSHPTLCKRCRDTLTS
jgi:isoleucyl-tRNA synthetase